MTKLRFGKLPHLRSRAEFLRVQGKGRSIRGRYMVLVLLKENDAQRSRIGFTVSRKVGNAVIRNRVRRRLREILRTHPDHLISGYDFVVIAFSRAATAPFSALEKELLWLLQKARLSTSSRPS